MLTLLFLAQALAQAACAPSGSTIRVDARTADYKPADVTYVVDHRRRERLRWVRISVPSPLVVNTAPQFLKMPLEWRGAIEPAADGRTVNVAWTAISHDATIAPHGAAAFRLRGAQRFVFRPGDSA